MWQNVRHALVLAILFIAVTPVVAHADVNNFPFDSYDADYYISRDVEQRSTLRVHETLVAVFPEIDQNHGIERAIPDTYQSHPVDPQVTSVKNGQGEPLKYTTSHKNENTVLRIGDADRYVHGAQTYVIDYSLRDVTLNLDTGDEFYWDTNGTGWAQTFANSQVRIHVDKSIDSALDGRTACYSGAQGSQATNCIIDTKTGGAGTVITVLATQPLGSYENMTAVVGFKPGTFKPYEVTPTPLWVIVLIGFGIVLFYIALPFIGMLWAYHLWRKHGQDKSKILTIIPQYIPPKGISVIRSDVIIHLSMQPKAVSATIIDLAVRRYIKIYEVADKEYELELVKTLDDLNEDDLAVIGMLFDPPHTVGSRIALKDKTMLFTTVAELKNAAFSAAVRDALLVDTKKYQTKMYVFAVLFLLISFAFNPLAFIAAVVLYFCAAAMPARTESGVALKQYLDGTKMYMEVAEKDRLDLLQAPGTAEKVDISDKGQLVKLYERLLPLAMLYGIEKEWAQQFAALYAVDTSPDWYVSNTNGFQAVAFASALSNFGTTATTNFSPPVSSGSSGFSGGSSGGGGGGGGGGGW